MSTDDAIQKLNDDLDKLGTGDDKLSESVTVALLNLATELAAVGDRFDRLEAHWLASKITRDLQHRLHWSSVLVPVMSKFASNVEKTKSDRK